MIHLLEKIELKDYVAIIPSVSVGNVGQLAADLLIFTFNFKKLGYIRHPQMLAFASADPYGRSSLISSEFEVFFSSELKVIVFQVRTKFCSRSSFLDDLIRWLKDNDVKQVILLAGCSAHERRDKQLLGEPLRYLFCPLTKIKEIESANNRNWLEFEKVHGNNFSGESRLPFIPGSGVAVKLFNKCIKEGLPCSVLLEFCSDGNNVPDSIKLANYLNDWLQLKEKSKVNSWIIPPSWSLLFGSHPPTEIFN